MAGFTRGDVGDAYSQSPESWTPQFGLRATELTSHGSRVMTERSPFDTGSQNRWCRSSTSHLVGRLPSDLHAAPTHATSMVSWKATDPGSHGHIKRKILGLAETANSQWVLRVQDAKSVYRCVGVTLLAERVSR